MGAPNTIAGLQYWLKSDTGVFQDLAKTNPCTNGTTVACWADQSGNGIDFTQGTALNRPTFNTAQVNGLPAVRFGLSTGVVLNSTHARVAQPFTIIGVFKTITLPGALTYAVLYGGATAPLAGCYFYNNIAQPQMWATQYGLLNPLAPLNHWDEWYQEFAGLSTTMTLNPFTTAFVNFGGPGQNPGSNGIQNTSLGADAPLGGANTPYLGHVAEFLLYNRILLPAEQASIAAYFAARYGLILPTVAPALAAISLNPTTVAGGTSVTGTVYLTDLAPAGGIVVTLSSSSGSATVPANVTVLAGTNTANFTITTSAVGSSTPATIQASYNSVNQSEVLTIVPVLALLEVTLAPTTVQGGNNSTGTVTLTGVAPGGGIVVSLTSGNAAATVPANVTVAAGAQSATFTITTSAVLVNTTSLITGTYNAVNQTATLTMTRAPALIELCLAPTVVQGGATSTGTVTLSLAAPIGGITVALSSSSGSATVPASVTVLAGNQSATFTITTSAVLVNTNSTIQASYNAVNQTGTLTMTPAPALIELTVNPTDVLGTVNSTGTVTLSAPAPVGGIVVALSSANAGVASVPASVTVLAGNQTATFTVTTFAVGVNTPVVLTATYNTVNQTATITVNAPAAPSGTPFYDKRISATQPRRRMP